MMLSSAIVPSKVPSSTEAANTSNTAAVLSASGSRDELFAGQLSDALVGTEQPLPEMAEVVAADAQAPAETELSAEEWLLAMIEQQLVQIQAREASAPESDAADVTATALSSVLSTSAINEEQLPVGNALPNDRLSEKAFTAAAAAGKSTERDVHASLTDKLSTSKLTADKLLTTNPHAQVQTAVPHAEADASTATGSNATAGVSAAAHLAGANAAQVDAISSPSAVSPAAASGEQAASRTVQSHLSLQTPEAKWGEQLLHALRDNVQVQIQQKIQNATIRLDPPELGSLEIYLSHEAGRLTVNITASQADVARLIQQTSDRLRHELAGPQFTQVNVQTSADGQSGQQQSRERQRFSGDEMILANEQPLVSNQAVHRPGDVLVTV